MNNQYLNRIMKDYEDKKAEIDALLNSGEYEKELLRKETDEIILDLDKDIKRLETRLDKTRMTKKEEIDKYIEGVHLSNLDISSAYAESVRRDLYNAYEAMEKDIEDAIESLKDQKMKTQENFLSQIQSINKNINYENVYLRELADQKDQTRKELIAYKKEVQQQLEEENLKLSQDNLNLSNFKYEYDEENRVLNGQDAKALLDSFTSTQARISELTNLLNLIDENIKLMEPSEDETKARMVGLTPLEQQEYDRRNKKEQYTNIEPNNIQTEDVIENLDQKNIDDTKNEIGREKLLQDFKKHVEESDIDFSKDDNELSNKVIENQFSDNEEKELSNNQSFKDDVEEIVDPVKVNYSIENGNVVVENKKDLLKYMYNDIVDEADNLSSIKLSSSKGALDDSKYYVGVSNDSKNYQYDGSTISKELDEGEYVNLSEIEQALDNLYEKNKGVSYVVSDTGKKYKISKRTINKLKKQLTKCSMLRLVKENKLSENDITAVYGKQALSDSLSEQLGTVNDTKEGYYVSRNDMILALDKAFSRKRIDWLRKVSNEAKNTQDTLNDPNLGQMIDEEQQKNKIIK